MNKLFPIILFFIIGGANFVNAQHTIQHVQTLQGDPKVYTAKKISQEIEIDGKMEAIWNNAPWSSEFMDIEGVHKTKPKYQTQFKMLWDEANLYIYAKLEEPHIWGTLKQHDAIIYHDNDFEIFIKPKLSSPVYYEIEINALNTVMDLLMPKPYRFGGQAVMHWDTKNIKSAVHVYGTLNNPNDIDSYWAVEMAIPFTSLGNFGGNPTPKVNSYWRINFSRVQWQHDIINQNYIRKKENGKIIEEDNWVWSPIGLINMHYPEKWGFLKFADDDLQSALPVYYNIEKTAWNIHYLQQLYKNKHQYYTADLKLLEGFSSYVEKNLSKYDIQITLSADMKFYHILLKEKGKNYYFTIDSHGNYTTNYE
ncbi:carbohydrate-binding family 9-like protein [Sphingobacterium sp. SGL-16]|uniref:carbohydrate-binding family 9-like protein n=1 Tax=Sphingobacterium sp. SGL-16 TaxID=2710883 RepID=UPI0013ED4476|nr:carbohydrate-binding family 9-like protein [Sphingobacterium sp. SGL-16]NGM74066.1 hypothetical protein [Sphingobacterium sp. SGL-16]